MSWPSRKAPRGPSRLAQQKRTRAVVALDPRIRRRVALELPAFRELDESLHHVLILRRLDRTRAVHEAAAIAHQARRRAEKRELLRVVTLEVPFLQAPFHVDTMTHHAGVAARHVEQ